MNEILIYVTEGGLTKVDVRLDADTVWLTQDQIAVLFDRERSVVTKHLRNVFKDGELDEKSNVQILHIASSDKPVKFYNLDTIISVGYRINSKLGIQFRKWATGVLREHLIQGYTLNQSRIADRGIQEAQQAIELLARTLNNQALVSERGTEVLSIIVKYAKTWKLLLQYDENELAIPDECRPSVGSLNYTQAIAAVGQIKSELLTRGEATQLFGQERDATFEGILGNIEQSMFDNPLYHTREEKAAHLLYFIIKDHPFTDGNKRIGSFMFLLYLQQENMNMSLSENALTALALLIAESEPSSKDLMIRLIVNLLTDH